MGVLCGPKIHFESDSVFLLDESNDAATQRKIRYVADGENVHPLAGGNDRVKATHFGCTDEKNLAPSGLLNVFNGVYGDLFARDTFARHSGVKNTSKRVTPQDADGKGS